LRTLARTYDRRVILETQMSPSVKHSIRNTLIAVIGIGGGLLQFLYTSTSHPSMLLEIWAWLFGVVVVLTITSLTIHGVVCIRRRRD